MRYDFLFIASIVLIVTVAEVVVWACWKFWRGVVEARESEPETHGDDGGRPAPAPETGSGLRAGGETRKGGGSFPHSSAGPVRSNRTPMAVPHVRRWK